MKIDLVYTWVNSNDKEWKYIYKLYIKKLKPGKKSIQNRFDNCDELKYSLLSAKKYAKNIIRNIYIVVANKSQIKDQLWLLNEIATGNSNLKIIMHSDIFPEKYQQDLLPTFNSTAIELHLHRIPGLSTKYLYLNDDMFFCNYVEISDFITSDGKDKIFLDKDKIADRVELKKKSPLYDYYISKILHREYSFTDAIKYTNYSLDKLIENKKSISKKRYMLQHLGYIHDKRCDKEIYNILDNYGLYLTTCSRFRENINIKFQSLFYPHYAISQNYAVPEYKPIGIKVSKDHQKWFEQIRKKRPKQICLNKLTKKTKKLDKFYREMFGTYD